MKKIAGFLSLVLVLFSFGIKAEQGCAPGFFPGGNQPGGPTCIPIPGYGTTNNTTDSSGAVWANRWGAIAFGGDVAGVSEGLPNRRKAKKAALEDCESGGGLNCKVVMTYFNQCAAVATGPGNGSYGQAPSLKVAEDLAMKEWSARSSGSCRVLYSACSMPERIR